MRGGVEVVDIAGLVSGSSTGEGLGNRFLAGIREVDALCLVLRAFDDPEVVGEVLAAVVEAFITQYGITAVLWGLVQGVGAELGFALFRYRTYNLTVLAIAGAVSGLLSWMLDFVYSNYLTLAHWIWAVQSGSALIGGAFWAGVVAWLIARGILRTGVMQNIMPDVRE